MNTKVRAMAAQLNKKYGEETVVVGSDLNDRHLPRIPTGSLSLDIALGGGWPANQFHEIIGSESMGKTMLVLKTIAENQRLDPKWTTAWIAAEHFVPEYADKLGVDRSRVLVVNTNVMEHAFEAALKFLDSREFDCVVIDSLPALVPLSEADEAMEQFQVGLGARLTGKFFRKQGQTTKRSLIHSERRVTGFVINQWRQKIGITYGDNRTTPGGIGKNYYYFTRVEVNRDDWIKDGDRRVGQVVKCRAIKNKSHPPHRTAVLDFYFDDFEEFRAGEYDSTKEIVQLSILYEVLERKGAYYSFGDQKWNGRGPLLEQLREDLDLRNLLEKEVMASALPTASATQVPPTAKKIVRRKK